MSKKRILRILRAAASATQAIAEPCRERIDMAGFGAIELSAFCRGSVDARILRAYAVV